MAARAPLSPTSFHPLVVGNDQKGEPKVQPNGEPPKSFGSQEAFMSAKPPKDLQGAQMTFINQCVLYKA